MPLVDYQCQECGTLAKDVLVKKTDAPAPRCVNCGGRMEKMPPLSNWAFNRKERRWDA